MGKQFNYGGQAVMEGVMMRGSRHMAVAVRDPEGNIVTHEEPLDSPLYNGWMSRVPFLRGLGLLWDSLGLGMRALMWSADISAGDEADIEGPVAWGTVATSMSIAIVLFFLLPAAAGGGLQRLAENFITVQGVSSPLWGNLLEGAIRLVIVIGYIWAIGQIEEIRRVYAYHGAEHKTINAYEANADLTPESVARFPLEHPRCGTGFLLVVVALSILIGALLGRPPILLRLASRIVIIPVVAALAYEYIKLLARNMDSPIVQILVSPQLAMQKLTTREPDADMLEVAITALERVLESEQVDTIPATEVEPAVK